MRLLALLAKEFRQFRRDRRMVVMALVAPVLQLLLLGYAANLDVQQLPVAVCDQDRSSESRRLVAEIEQTGYFRLVEETQRTEDLQQLLDLGKAQLALHIPPGFSDALRKGAAPLQLIVDGSDSNSAGVGAGYLAGLVVQHGQLYLIERLKASGMYSRVPTIQTEPRIFYNPALESRFFMVLGVMGMVLMIISGTLTALAIVKEREAGTLEQVMVTPIRARELLLGKLVPYMVVGSVDALLVLSVLLFWFQVPHSGSLVLFLFSCLLYLMTASGMGLLVSTLSTTQQQAQMLMFLIMFPNILLSGFIFPIANMPQWLQTLTYAVPMRYFLVCLRSIMLRGAGLVELWPQLLAMLGLGLLLVGAGALTFRKRL